MKRHRPVLVFNSRIQRLRTRSALNIIRINPTASLNKGCFDLFIPKTKLARWLRVTYPLLSVAGTLKPTPTPQGQCAGAEVCPLSRVPVGATVCIKTLGASPEVREKLRALGLSE